MKSSAKMSVSETALTGTERAQHTTAPPLATSLDVFSVILVTIFQL